MTSALSTYLVYSYIFSSFNLIIFINNFCIYIHTYTFLHRNILNFFLKTKRVSSNCSCSSPIWQCQIKQISARRHIIPNQCHPYLAKCFWHINSIFDWSNQHINKIATKMSVYKIKKNSCHYMFKSCHLVWAWFEISIIVFFFSLNEVWLTKITAATTKTTNNTRREMWSQIIIKIMVCINNFILFMAVLMIYSFEIWLTN